jgi:hypothetical protein
VYGPPSGTRAKVKAPDASVLVPWVKFVLAFFKMTETPGTGSLLLFCTTPLTWLVCACAMMPVEKRMKERKVRAKQAHDLNELNLIQKQFFVE